jgi:hypothetical protein
VLAGIAFAVVVSNDRMKEALVLLGPKNDITSRESDIAKLVGRGEVKADSAILRLAEALSHSPAHVTDEVLSDSKDISPAAIVEIVAFLGVLQSIHRLEAYYYFV